MSCVSRYRFVEIYYRRPEIVHKGHLIPARVETVVIFLPDINSCMPTRSEWEKLQQTYKATFERVLYQAEHPAEDDAAGGDGSAVDEQSAMDTTLTSSKVAAGNESNEKAGVNGGDKALRAKGSSESTPEDGGNEKAQQVFLNFLVLI